MTARRLPDPPPWAHELVTAGVTGTNGKTTTTTLIGAALAADHAPVVRITSLGAFLDGPRIERLDVSEDYAGFIAAMQQGRLRGARRAAIELTSEALAAGFARAWPCTVGVLTSFDRDHLDAHGSAEHYLASKAQLFVNLPSGGTALLNAGESASALVAEVVPPSVRTLYYGLVDRAPDPELLAVAGLCVRLAWDGTTIELGGSAPDLPSELSTRAIGMVFAENALAALAAAWALGVPAARAAAAIASAAPPPGRFELVAERPWVVVDYAHTPDALARTVAAARELCRGRLSLVFGAGGNRDHEKRRLMGQAARAADRVIVSNDNPRDEDPAAIAAHVLAGLDGHADVRRELDRERAIELAIGDAGPDDVVVLAGRGHETVQVIGGERRPLSDVEVARRVHARRS